MSIWKKKYGTCEVCKEHKHLGKSSACRDCRRSCIICKAPIENYGHCPACRIVQDSIQFLHTKYKGIRDPRPEIREQLIQQHTERIQAELARLEPAGDSADL